MNLIMGISSVEASPSCVPFDCTNDCSRSSRKLLKMSFRSSSRQRCHVSSGPDRERFCARRKARSKATQRSDASVESLSHHRGLPIFPRRVAASFSPANPRCAGFHSNLRMKLRRRTCLPSKWSPSSRRKCRAAVADKRHFQSYRPRILVSSEMVQAMLVALLSSINPVHDLQWPSLRVTDKNVRGSRSNVTVSEGCQQDNGKHFRSNISVLFGVPPRSL